MAKSKKKSARKKRRRVEQPTVVGAMAAAQALLLTRVIEELEDRDGFQSPQDLERLASVLSIAVNMSEPLLAFRAAVHTPAVRFAAVRR